MAYTRLVLTGALFALTSFHAASEPVQIILSGVWSGADVQVESGMDWWGLFPDGDGFKLESAPITVTRAFDGMVDSEGEMTGKEVAIPKEANPLLLARGLNTLEAGPVVTVKPPGDSWPFLHPGQDCEITLNPADVHNRVFITALGTAESKPDSMLIVRRTYELRISKGQGEDPSIQSLAKYPEFTGTHGLRLLWAGDLDRDGRVDLLYNLSTWHMSWHLGLFLSSAAKEGDLVGLVAEWVTTGC
tara:strand:+ start:493 stop:1227 length:735 start_codon:yes stop_codon:yes gene_type:complete